MTWDPNATTIRIVTRGRVTGAEHPVTTWFACAGGAVYVAARGGLRSDWVRNVLATPAVELRRRRRSWTAVGAIVDDGDEVAGAVEAFADKYVQHPGVVDAWRADPPTFVRFRWTE